MRIEHGGAFAGQVTGRMSDKQQQQEKGGPGVTVDPLDEGEGDLLEEDIIELDAR
jgi:hypothetical protein